MVRWALLCTCPGARGEMGKSMAAELVNCVHLRSRAVPLAHAQCHRVVVCHDECSGAAVHAACTLALVDVF